MSDEELEELEKFLMSENRADGTMTLDMVDGYLTAIVVGPRTILPSEWMPRVWGDSEDDAPEFESVEQAQRITELLMRHMNGIIWDMQDDPDAFEPLLFTTKYEDDPREYLDGEFWTYGFLDGVDLCRKDWQPLYDDAVGQRALEPMYLLGEDVVNEGEDKLILSPEQREDITKEIAESVAAIYRFWLPRRKEQHERLVGEAVKRTEPKVGRNDVCPCGSGKKFKKCCGAAPTLH